MFACVSNIRAILTVRHLLTRQQLISMWNSFYADYVIYYSVKWCEAGWCVIDDIVCIVGVRCDIHNCYTGVIYYVDDIAMNAMLEVCNKFALEQHRIFNSTESIALKYGYAEEDDAEFVMLGQDNIRWIKNVIHLGNYYNTQMSNNIQS